MQQYKKRLRLLVEEIGGEIAYLHNEALGIQFESRRVEFVPTSRADMEAIVDLGNGTQTLYLPKQYCFDVTDCLSCKHRAAKLPDYHVRYLLQLSDYIQEEQGEQPLKELQTELAQNPDLERRELGGNIIFPTYYRGILILRYDLASGCTNVLEFNATTSLLDAK
ncbi:hypothetical protein [Blastopirellula marina]|uniref:Uncharacterized protein n=1 Tax=Blastopirellula marina TaxID=124 RepID=A0A2S8GPQ1_9BACT|nr:hypothetical protein [Blastopirellula marina]PQO46331.1 hypothetical protein C5Y93_10130 [Blastopirellula marina]